MRMGIKGGLGGGNRYGQSRGALYVIDVGFYEGQRLTNLGEFNGGVHAPWVTGHNLEWGHIPAR